MGPLDPPAVASAVHMLALFESVGATSFDITHTDINQERTGFRRDQSLAMASESMPHLMKAAERRQRNIIVRPRSETTDLIQLDDLNEEKARKAAPAAFLVLETSPGSYQAWIAVKDAPIGTTSRLRKGAGADKNASGATRVAGTANYKAKYAPDFPRVRIAGARRGHVVTAEELEELGLLAPAPPVIQSAKPVQEGRTNKWPSYQRCLDDAPIGTKGNASRTAADFVWCKIAASWGHSIEGIAARLLQESTKAQENGKRYALDTAKRAAWAAEQRNAKRTNLRP